MKNGVVLLLCIAEYIDDNIKDLEEAKQAYDLCRMFLYVTYKCVWLLLSLYSFNNNKSVQKYGYIVYPETR